MMYSQFAKDVANKIMKGDYVKVLVGDNITEIKSLSQLELIISNGKTIKPLEVVVGNTALPKPAEMNLNLITNCVILNFTDTIQAEKFYDFVAMTMVRG